MSLRVLHVLDHSIPLHSGYTFRTRAIIDNQRALGWETEHITSPKHVVASGAFKAKENIDGLVFYRTNLPNSFLDKLPVLDQWAMINALARRLEQVVIDVKPDIIHAHSPVLNGLAALRVARLYRTPIVYEVRAFWEDAAVDHGTCKEWGARYRITRALESYVVNRANAVTTICEGLRSDLIGRGVREDKITVIPNAVDISHFTVGSEADPTLADELGLLNMVVLGFIGSFYAYEGLDLLLRAMPHIIKIKPNTRILLVGGGPQEKYLHQLANDLGIMDKVIFTGRVPHDQVHRYYDLIDVLVYPRISMRLTELVTPLKPLEAMAQGRLVLASSVGGHRELIESNVNGLLFTAGDKMDLIENVLKLLEKNQRWDVIRLTARRFVEKQRNWMGSVSRYRDVYQELLGRHHGK